MKDNDYMDNNAIEVNPNKQLWDRSAFEIKALYEAEVIDRSVPPTVTNHITTAKETIVCNLRICLRKQLEDGNCNINIPYYIFFGTNSFNSHLAITTYQNHIKGDTEFILALKSIFSYLKIKKIRIQAADRSYFFVSTS